MQKFKSEYFFFSKKKKIKAKIRFCAKMVKNKMHKKKLL